MRRLVCFEGVFVGRKCAFFRIFNFFRSFARRDLSARCRCHLFFFLSLTSPPLSLPLVPFPPSFPFPRRQPPQGHVGTRRGQALLARLRARRRSPRAGPRGDGLGDHPPRKPRLGFSRRRLCVSRFLAARLRPRGDHPGHGQSPEPVLGRRRRQGVQLPGELPFFFFFKSLPSYRCPPLSLSFFYLQSSALPRPAPTEFHCTNSLAKTRFGLCTTSAFAPCVFQANASPSSKSKIWVL